MGVIVVLAVGVLIFKYFQGLGKTSQFKEIKEEEEKEEKIVEEIPTTYLVKENDNLWKIAEQSYGSGYNWVDIAKENNLVNPDIIFVGTELRIPDVEKRTPILKPVKEEPITEERYTVVKGDNLWNICLRAYGDGYRWPQIAKINNLKNPNLIHPGNVLTLPR